MVDPEQHFRKGLVIPRCKLPPKDAVSYYMDPASRGYLADMAAIMQARLQLAQKYGYRLPEVVPGSSLDQMLRRRKDPYQIWYGLEPGWLVSLVDQCILKPADPDIKRYFTGHNWLLLICSPPTLTCWCWLSGDNGCVQNQQSNRSRSSQICQMRSIQSDEEERVRQIISKWHTLLCHSLCPIIPQSLWLAIWNCLLECLRHMPHGRGLQNLSVKSDFSQMLPSRSRFDCEWM